MNTIEYKKVSEINIDGKLMKKIGYKPYTSVIIGFIAGIGLIALKNVLSIILGAFFLIICIITLFFIKDYKVMDIYDIGVLIYNVDDPEMGTFIYYDDIDRWTIKRDNGANEAIYFKLQDGNEIYKNTFQSSKAFRSLNEFISDKEEMSIKGKQIGEKTSASFKNLFKKK